MRAIGYFRYDPATPDDSPNSRSHQEREFHSFCQQKGHTPVALYADHQEEEEGRRGLDGMIQQIRQPGSGFLVVVRDPTHLGSTLEEAVERLLTIDQLGSQVICTNAEMPDPLQGLMRAFLNTGGGATRRRRIREAMQAKAIRGEGLGKPPYGYRIGRERKLEEVPREADLVRLMFRLYVEEGLGVRRIAGYLNERGFLTRRGQGWSMVTIRDILRNSVHIGTYSRFGLRLPGTHQRLISPEQFRKAQDLMYSRRPRGRRGKTEPFLLSGLVSCGQCGNGMIGVTRRQVWRRKDGERMRGLYRYYQCQSRTNQSRCDYHTWRAADLEEAVVVKIRQGLAEMERALPPAENSSPSSISLEELPTQERETARPLHVHRRYLRYLQQAADGAIPLTRLRALLEELRREGRELEEGGAVSRGQGRALSTIVEMVRSSADWERGDWATRRGVLKGLVEGVEVRDGEAVVRLKSLPGNG